MAAECSNEVTPDRTLSRQGHARRWVDRGVHLAELLEMIRNGEGSGVEFKRDDVHPDSLAKEMSALLNHEGGWILLGVDDSGEISGLVQGRQKAEEWVMNIASQNLQPPVIAYWNPLTIDDKTVGAIRLHPDSPDKPYKARRGSAWITFVRIGSTSREATRDQEGRLYQAAGLMRYDLKSVSGTSLDSLDRGRIWNYFTVVRKRRNMPSDQDDDKLKKLLLNRDFLSEAGGAMCATVAGLLLFGRNPNRRLPQAGITAASFPTRKKDYNTVDEELIRGPLVSKKSARGGLLEAGVIDRAVNFVERNMGSSAWLEGGKRRRKKALPRDAIRESIVNAVTHRDYSIVGTDVEVSLYEDRLEVISPGRLPNGITVDKMKEGGRAARNELLKEILRDYGYVEHQGMGVREKIIESMSAHNGTEPDLDEDDYRFSVRLWKTPNHR